MSLRPKGVLECEKQLWNFALVSGQDWARTFVSQFRLVTSAEREVMDSRHSGMFQSCFRMSRSCFGISSRYLRVLRFILSGERNNYEEEMTFITSAEREVKDSRRSGMFQSCIRMSQSCFRMSRSCLGLSSRYLRILWFILISDQSFSSVLRPEVSL